MDFARDDIEHDDLVVAVTAMEHRGKLARRVHRNARGEIADPRLASDGLQEPLVRQTHRGVVDLAGHLPLQGALGVEGRECGEEEE